MKIIMYMQTTINGFIAQKDDNVSWISPIAWNHYEKVTKEFDAFVLGRKTFELMEKKDFDLNILYIVMTRKKRLDTKSIEFKNKTPTEIVTELSQRGMKRVLIAGGSQINSLFMKAGLIDEIYIDIEAYVFGRGIPLFFPEDFEYALKLQRTKKIGQNTVQLRYKVTK